MKHEKELKITKKLADYINRLLTEGDKDFGEDETITETVVFDDGHEMDIKVCGVQWEEGEDNTAWTEAVLYESDGAFGWAYEVCCSEPSDEFLGEWEMEHRKDKYIVNVIVEN